MVFVQTRTLCRRKVPRPRKTPVRTSGEKEAGIKYTKSRKAFSAGHTHCCHCGDLRPGTIKVTLSYANTGKCTSSPAAFLRAMSYAPLKLRLRKMITYNKRTLIFSNQVNHVAQVFQKEIVRKSKTTVNCDQWNPGSCWCVADSPINHMFG